MQFVIQEKRIFFTARFWLVLWLCISKTICRAWEGGFSKMIQMCFHWFHKVPNNSLNLLMLNFFSSTFPTCENYVLSYSYFIVFPLIIHILEFITKYLFDYRDPKVPIPCSKITISREMLRKCWFSGCPKWIQTFLSLMFPKFP